MKLNNKGFLKSYKFTSKTYSTMSKKYFIPFYAEHLSFLIKRCSSLLAKPYAHYTFKQSKIKKEFVIMSRVSRQNSNTSIEKDFYKLMNNSNFGNSCRNNVGNYFLP